VGSYQRRSRGPVCFSGANSRGWRSEMRAPSSTRRHSQASLQSQGKTADRTREAIARLVHAPASESLAQPADAPIRRAVAMLWRFLHVMSTSSLPFKILARSFSSTFRLARSSLVKPSNRTLRNACKRRQPDILVDAPWRKHPQYHVVTQPEVGVSSPSISGADSRRIRPDPTRTRLGFDMAPADKDQHMGLKRPSCSCAHGMPHWLRYTCDFESL
jgi:hypothetical protein